MNIVAKLPGALAAQLSRPAGGRIRQRQTNTISQLFVVVQAHGLADAVLVAVVVGDVRRDASPHPSAGALANR